MLKPKNPIWLDLTCLHCGAAIWILKSQTKGGAGKFCSRHCARTAQFLQKSNLSPMTKERFAAHFGSMKTLTGKDHPGWQEPICFTWDEANRRDNLVGMCQSCHMKTEPRGKGWRGLDTQLKNRAEKVA